MGASFFVGADPIYALGVTIEEILNAQEKTITPTKEAQSIIPDIPYNALSKVTVTPIPDNFADTSDATALAAYILSGYSAYIDGVKTDGTMANRGAITGTLDVSTTRYAIPIGYHDGFGSVQIVLEQKSATPTKSTQEITPASGKVLSSVSIDPIPSNYMDTSDATGAADRVMLGDIVYVNGERVQGTLVTQNYYTGSSEPSSSLGSDGDLYLRA